LVAALLGTSAVLAPSMPVGSSSHLMGHITIEQPGRLTPEAARDVYRKLAPQMADGYAQARLALIRDYQDWRRYNTAPYLSATHGNRYVNNYANHLATNYERVGEIAGLKMPSGTVLAKDSFSLTDDGKVFPAPLFVMEKLEPNASPQTGDWRYVSILPDGSIFADSHGARHEQANFCHECHIAVADADYLYFVPPEFHATE
jgi:hypothetical protein